MAGAAAALVPSLSLAGPAAAQSSGSGVLLPNARFEPVCTPTDPALAELSGLAVLDGKTYGIGDSGTDDAVVVLDGNCAVTGTVPVPVDPYDIEDMGVGPDGRLWLADTGDNLRARSTVALIALDPASGDGQLHRLTYPDGPHDAEALLMQRDGVPLIVTKEVLVANGVYRPAGGVSVDGLASPGPTALERVGELRIGPTTTPGGPVPVGGSTLVTGGAVSADGTVAALRTYTDVYLFSAPDGDLARALTTTTPVRVALPNQPQGEAIAFTPGGDLLAGSESAGGPLPPLQVLPGAVDLTRNESWSGGSVSLSASTGEPAASDTTEASDSAGPDDGAAQWSTPVLLGGALVAGLATFGLVWRRSRPRRH
ncbi:hypothetical protein [Prescottella equi]|uniref:Membrane protein n=1 Tax=Rhodococcus hoagii (strain 103S) TaxID=685727 RepID=A0A3S5Y678_RHOH1|nr:hypothetical protein [Prescottella equi]MBM9837649.1 hypothetical protein [Prescottella equi]MDP8015374.1 hypothetical protein [Prescottella equi]NKT16203.1 hypothetical protein [Prescottella equi]NKW61892.1 hypothetical protein [Prescottella equi]NKX06344.1 hypothetical protein [Prescottella equi]